MCLGTYLPQTADVKGLAVNSKNEVIVTDAANHCVYIGMQSVTLKTND